MRVEYIFIPIMFPSFNAWETMHWAKKKTEKQRIKEVAKLCIKAQKLKPFENPVIIELQPYVGKATKIKKGNKKLVSTRKFDCSNYCINLKYFEDSVVECGLLPDDNNDFVYYVRSNACIQDRTIDDDGIIMKIQEVEEGIDKDIHSEYEHILSTLRS